MWGIFFGEFQCLPVDDCPAASCDSGVLTSGSPHPALSTWHPYPGVRGQGQREGLGRFGEQSSFPTAGIPDSVSFYSVLELRGAEEDSRRIVGQEGLHLICHILGQGWGGGETRTKAVLIQVWFA